MANEAKKDHAMLVDRIARTTDSPASNIISFEGRRDWTIASYERELARQETRLREARACSVILLRRQDELIRIRDALHALLDVRENAARRFAGLTPRQRQIMDLVLAGHPSKNIAADLQLSQRTVENHRAAIMHKTGTKCLPALARLAAAASWNDDNDPLAKPLARLEAAVASAGTGGTREATGTDRGGYEPTIGRTSAKAFPRPRNTSRAPARRSALLIRSVGVDDGQSAANAGLPPCRTPLKQTQGV